MSETGWVKPDDTHVSRMLYRDWVTAEVNLDSLRCRANHGGRGVLDLTSRTHGVLQQFTRRSLGDDPGEVRAHPVARECVDSQHNHVGGR